LPHKLEPYIDTSKDIQMHCRGSRGSRAHGALKSSYGKKKMERKTNGLPHSEMPLPSSRIASSLEEEEDR
jgi:hypothetical protein